MTSTLPDVRRIIQWMRAVKMDPTIIIWSLTTELDTGRHRQALAKV
jgi:beta-galactosidase/beta-glucuronidase